MRRTVLGFFLVLTGCTESVQPPPTVAPAAMQLLGGGDVGVPPYVAEVAVQGTTAYTTTWSFNATNPGNRIDIWDVSGNTPARLNSIHIATAGVVTLGDVSISEDGNIMIVATERSPGMIVVFDISTPRAPVELSRFTSPNTEFGVHTAKLGTVNGKLHAFLAAVPGLGFRARMVIVDLGEPAAPREVHVRLAEQSFVHDTFFRDGYLFIAQWNDGVVMLDIGVEGTVESPKELGKVLTQGGAVHNVWWYKSAGSAAPGPYLFVGEEGPGLTLSRSSGDIHVVKMSAPGVAPEEVAFYNGGEDVGTHNFWMDEERGILYAAFYNGGVRALDVTGTLENCSAAARAADGRCDLAQMGREVGIGLQNTVPVYIWGVRYVPAGPGSDGLVYASDMLGKLWKLRALPAR